MDQLDIEIGDGEFLVLVGPSGCGKSTSLRMLAGLEDVNGGRILIGDRDVTNLAPKDRDIAMVFQNYALYPHMTVAENMGFALKIAGEDKERDPQAGGRGRQDPRPRAVPRPQAQGALRRPAPARRHGPRDRPLAAGLPHGRAAVEPRREAARADPQPDRGPAAPARRHDRLRHPRPGRGHDHGRPRCGAQGRHPAAGRHAAAHVRQPEQRLRGRVHRLAGHEPADGADRGQLADLRRRAHRGAPRDGREGRRGRPRGDPRRPARGHGSRRRGRGAAHDGQPRRGARRRRLRLRHGRRQRRGRTT